MLRNADSLTQHNKAKMHQDAKVLYRDCSSWQLRTAALITPGVILCLIPVYYIQVTADDGPTAPARRTSQQAPVLAECVDSCSHPAHTTCCLQLSSKWMIDGWMQTMALHIIWLRVYIYDYRCYTRAPCSPWRTDSWHPRRHTQTISRRRKRYCPSKHRVGHAWMWGESRFHHIKTQLMRTSGGQARLQVICSLPCMQAALLGPTAQATDGLQAAWRRGG